jgi:hypothetical protein
MRSETIIGRREPEALGIDDADGVVDLLKEANQE